MNDKGKSGKVTFGNTAFMPKEEHLETALLLSMMDVKIRS
jgi:hypothetical protein